MPRTVTVGRRAAVAAGCQCSLPDPPQPLEGITTIGPASRYCFPRFFSPPSVKGVCIPETLAVGKRAPWR